jgi:hypothetical protein
MFLGHFAVALAAKKAAPKLSLGTLILSAQFIDLLWPIFLLLGIEHVRIDPGNTAFTPLDFFDYPLSHSLLTVVAWAAVVGGTYYLVQRKSRGALVLYGAVVSHWFLDALTHRADLPLSPGSQFLIGFGLWNSVAWTLAIELAMFGGAVVLYTRVTRPSDRIGRISFGALVLFLVAAYAGNVLGPLRRTKRSWGLSGWRDGCLFRGDTGSTNTGKFP